MTDDPCRRYCRAKSDLLRSQDRYAILERERDYWKQETEGLRRERDQWHRSSGQNFARAESLEDALEKSQSRASAAGAEAAKLRAALEYARERVQEHMRGPIDAALKGNAT